MAERTFRDLVEFQANQQNFLCVGLDPDLARIPACVQQKTLYGTLTFFMREIIDATCDRVCAYKPNTAFFEAHGTVGWRALEYTMQYLKRKCPDVIRILDAKRGDIGNTNNGYVSMAFDQLDADALTINPYLGAEANEPFLKHSDKGIIVLCRTSNPGADEFQELIVELTDEAFAKIHLGQPANVEEFFMPRRLPLYQFVAYRAAARSTGWNKYRNCALVVGATYPEQMKEVRHIVGDDMLILAPGVGKQGGDLEATVKAAKNIYGQNFIVNMSSDVLYASDGPDFAYAARRKVLEVRRNINRYR
jgi:orotidine-5'-phosphate decarboxylase